MVFLAYGCVSVPHSATDKKASYAERDLGD